MRVVADRRVCVGAGQCALFAPALFTQDEEEGLVEVLNELPVSRADRDAAASAVRYCPSGALTIDEG
ncbi:ferredoxin [Actinomadura sp. GTD37]|uniref:ferredoxin n=1 Tax=Actinomadura sp. GTD37 TaxID=1778030 RepID=UPI0035C128D6